MQKSPNIFNYILLPKIILSDYVKMQIPIDKKIKIKDRIYAAFIFLQDYLFGEYTNLHVRHTKPLLNIGH